MYWSNIHITLGKWLIKLFQEEIASVKKLYLCLSDKRTLEIYTSWNIYRGLQNIFIVIILTMGGGAHMLWESYIEKITVVSWPLKCSSIAKMSPGFEHAVTRISKFFVFIFYPRVVFLIHVFFVRTTFIRTLMLRYGKKIRTK